MAAILSAVTNAGDLHTSVVRSAFGAFAVGGIGSAVGAARKHDRIEMLWFTDRADVRAVVRGAWWGVATMLGSAAALVVALLTLHLDRAADLWALLDPGLGGGFALAAACLLFMPTLVLWAAAVLSVPGSCWAPTRPSTSPAPTSVRCPAFRRSRRCPRPASSRAGCSCSVWCPCWPA